MHKTAPRWPNVQDDPAINIIKQKIKNHKSNKNRASDVPARDEPCDCASKLYYAALEPGEAHMLSKYVGLKQLPNAGR